ncbi:kinase-interacting family protein-like isoform X2 [Aristolochia californica]|uniref:kinase-interacting family protein-like isoform X2 n=1 Tax=Aristolochia californica TaxID=171875 RepID=UPI0035DFF10F
MMSASMGWLHLSDLEHRIQALSVSDPEEDNSDTFAERAEIYYQKRPQLHALLQDLYNSYLSLADRYGQTLHKQHSVSHIPTIVSYADDESRDQDSDAESSLSYQQLSSLLHPKPSFHLSSDSVVAELVSRSVENDLLLNEIEILGRQVTESCKKTDLQQSLLEVLESERMVLLSENARLGFRAAALAEENKGLASEAAFMKRKATELARCVVKMRDDHRVCLLSRKIEDLQGQIHGLEKRNRDCYEQMARREEEKKEVAREFFSEVEKLKTENAKLKEAASKAKERGWRMSRWWVRIRRADLLVPCGPKQEWKLV